MNIEGHPLTEGCHYNIDSKISLQRKAYEEKACRYQLHCVGVLPARKLGTRCKLDKYNAYLQGEFTAGPPHPLPNKKLNAGVSGWLSVLYVQWICLKMT